MTEEEKKEYIESNCKHCKWCFWFKECVHFDFEDLEEAVEKCKGDEK